MSKNILCKLGFHQADKYKYEQVTRRHQNGKKYHKNYVICKRCGKRLRSFSVGKEKKALGISKAEYIAMSLLEHGLKVGGAEDGNI